MRWKKKKFFFPSLFSRFGRKLNKSLIIFPPLLTSLASFLIFREFFVKQQQRKKSMKRKINNSNSEDFQLSLCNVEFYVGVLEIDVLCCTSPSKSVSFVTSHVSHMCYFFCYCFSISSCVCINVEQAHVMA